MASNQPGAASERRARLLGVKLRALVRSRSEADATIVPEVFALGAAALVDGSAWVLVEDAREDGRGFGAAVVWALRRGAVELNVVAERGTGVMARRAGAFALPTVVWEPEGTNLRPAVAEPAGLVVDPDPRHLALVPEIEAAGASAVVEHAVVTGEVRGLEVCRVVDVDVEGHRAVRLEVGVGPHDREAFTMIHGDIPTLDALASVVRSVAAVRDLGVPGHPLSRLAPERFLRWRLEQHPEVLGFVSVEPVEPPVPRPNLKDRSPCSALAHRPDGGSVVVVPSVGVDLDVIPYAADARLAHEAGIGRRGSAGGDGGSVEVMVVAPARDLVAITSEMAAALRQPATLVPWPSSEDSTGTNSG